ncbi:MAG: TlpA family protein disulfide reductase [Balneolaceae bacterium]|nr:TlpA family protein disulfide reductase [Balneolaceae bacterium]
MNKKKTKSFKRSFIEWGAIIGVILLLYVTGWHTEVMGTMQRGLLATGLIKPDIPTLSEDFPAASTEFYFARDDGRVISLAEFEGNVVFMNVWATWCPPCIAEMPSIQNLYNRVGSLENVSFLLVSLDEEFDRAIEFMERRNFDMPVYHFRSRAPGVYESTVIPTTYVISADGRLALEKRGLAKYDTDEFEQFIRKLAGE